MAQVRRCAREITVSSVDTKPRTKEESDARWTVQRGIARRFGCRQRHGQNRLRRWSALRSWVWRWDTIAWVTSTNDEQKNCPSCNSNATRSCNQHEAGSVGNEGGCPTACRTV